MKDMVGYCGLDCETCDAYLATIRDDQALREKTAKLWAALNNAPILPEHISCEGCRAEGMKTVYCESLFEIRQCARKKGATTLHSSGWIRRFAVWKRCVRFASQVFWSRTGCYVR